MRFRADPLTHGMRAILTEAVAMKGFARKRGPRHECKISYSWSGLGATAASFAAVPGARAFGQRPAGTATGSMRFRADSLTHGMRAILTEAFAMKCFARKRGPRHECKISYSWSGLGATAASFAAVPGARAFGQRPGGTATGSMRFRAHSLTHARRAILMEGVVVNDVRRKNGARHECKSSYSWPGLGATAALFAAVPGARAFGQGPAGTATGSMRFRAHSLTHGMRAILTEAVAMKAFARKRGPRHECKISYSWPAREVRTGRAGRRCPPAHARRCVVCSRAGAARLRTTQPWHQSCLDLARILLLMGCARF